MGKEGAGECLKLLLKTVRICSLSKGELSGSGIALMGPGGSASLGFPFSASVSVSKQALTPEELLHHVGKGDFRHIPCAGGWDWAPGHVENESRVPGGRDGLGAGDLWQLVAEKRNPRISSLMHFLKGGVCPREQMSWIILWERGISSFSCFNCWKRKKKNHFILLFTSSLEHGHIYPAFNNLW